MPRAGLRMRWLGALLVLALVSPALGTWLNSRAFGDLLTSIETGEAVLETFNDEAAALVRSTPNVDSARADPQSPFADRVVTIAGQALQGVLVEQQHVRDVRLWPWDTDASQARSLYLEHLDAWERQLRGYQQRQPATASTDIDATFELLSGALEDAVPLLSADYRKRVQEITAE